MFKKLKSWLFGETAAEKYISRYTIEMDPDGERSLDQKLQDAVEENKHQTIRELIKEGADVNHRTSFGESMLQLAEERIDTVKLLIEVGAPDEALILEAIWDAIAFDFEEWESFVNLLPRERVDRIYKNQTPVTWAIGSYADDIARGLRGLGFDAVSRNGFGWSPAEIAMVTECEGFEDLVIDDDRKEVVDFYTAAWSSELDRLEPMVQTIDVNAQGPFGATPLMESLENTRIDFARILIDRGSSLDVQSEDGAGVCALAVDDGDPLELLKLLVDAGAAIQDEAGNSLALVNAALFGAEKCTTYLCELGANPNSVDTDGESALHFAIVLEREFIALELLKNGADPDYVGPGSTPREMADLFGRKKILKAMSEIENVDLDSADAEW